MPVKNISSINGPALGKEWAKCYLSQVAAPSHLLIRYSERSAHICIQNFLQNTLCDLYGKRQSKTLK